MAETKTCEQYVLNRLMETENKNAELDTQVNQLTIDFYHLEESMNTLIDIIKKHSRIRESEREDGSKYRYVSFDSIWEPYDVEDYEAFTSIVNYPDDKEENDGSSTGN